MILQPFGLEEFWKFGSMFACMCAAHVMVGSIFLRRDRGIWKSFYQGRVCQRLRAVDVPLGINAQVPASRVRHGLCATILRSKAATDVHLLLHRFSCWNVVFLALLFCRYANEATIDEFRLVATGMFLDGGGALAGCFVGGLVLSTLSGTRIEDRLRWRSGLVSAQSVLHTCRSDVCNIHSASHRHSDCLCLRVVDLRAWRCHGSGTPF